VNINKAGHNVQILMANHLLLAFNGAMHQNMHACLITVSTNYSLIAEVSCSMQLVNRMITKTVKQVTYNVQNLVAKHFLASDGALHHNMLACLITVSTNHSPLVEAAAVSEH
jgi:hypothetical protein